MDALFDLLKPWHILFVGCKVQIYKSNLKEGEGFSATITMKKLQDNNKKVYEDFCVTWL